MKETYATSSGTRTSRDESLVAGRTEIGKIGSVAMKETMICMVHIMINPLGIAHLQGDGTHGELGLAHTFVSA
jgi:hypothetical protein